MDPDLERVLRGLEEAADFAKTYRFEMTEDYIELIARVEALPTNQTGADKSGRWRGGRGRWDLTKSGRPIDPVP